MKSLRYFIILCVAVISGSLSAQSQRELGQLMRERGEYYFTLSVDNPKEIQAISEICSVDGTDGRTVVAYANQQEYNRLLQAGYQPNLQTPPSLREEARMWQGGDRATYDWNSYLTYGDYVSMMEGFPSSVTNGASCTLLDLGTLSTTNHRRILGVRLNNGQPDGKPKFLYTSTMHGDEVTGMILMLRLINEFCTSTDSRITNILNDVDLFIFPCTNPDGTYYGGNSSVSGARRYNGNGVDLNRHFPDFDDGAHPDGASSYQDEAQWMMDLAQQYLFTMGANYHGGAEVMNYPWDTYQPVHPDDAWWRYVSLEYVSNARANNSSYMTDTESNGITNGYAWYTITGSRQDYMNYYGQCREITIECSSTKTPSASQLPNFWNYNHTAMLAYIEQCLNGVHGFVYDAVTLQPIEGASVTVENHDALGSSVSSHTIGDFHRPIKGGTYTFTFAKQGYYPQSVQVTVADDDREDLTIYLQPNLNLEADFTASTTNVSLGQSISFTDTSEGMVSSWSWTFEGATPSSSTVQNPTGITYNTPGDYDVTLTVTGPGGTQTVTKENYIHVTESVIMQNGSVTTCSGLFYDSGGANSNYGNSLTYTMTFYPGIEGAMVSVAFSQFNTESSYDYLYIYDGTSISATQIGQYSGTNSPGTVTATNTEGALTFKFTSDQSVNNSGWVATVSCMTFERTISATANPAAGGTVEGAGVYTSGETCTLTAMAAENYQFIHWTENGEVVSTDATYSFQVTVDRDLVAVFGSTAPVNITVSASPARAGSVSGGGEFLCGETCTVIATPNEGYTFINWTEDGTLVSEDLEYSFIVTDGRDLVANFVHMTAIEVGESETTSYFLPSYSYYKQALTQQIYTAEEIGTAGTIMSIAFYNEGETRTRNYDFYLKTTEKSSFSSKTDWITVDVTDKVFSGNVTMTANAWTTITFDTPFEYDGISNLVLVADDNTGSYDSSPHMACSVYNTTLNQAIYIYSDNTNYNPMSPPTSSSGSGYGGNTNAVLTVKNHIILGIEVDLEEEQTITFAQGLNWWSTNLDITFDQLKNAIANAVGTNGTAMIKSQNGSVNYENGRWRGNIDFDIRKMYKIHVSSECTITLTGMLVNPADYEITISNGSNWIGFLSGESMNVTAAFAGLNPVEGDVVKSKTASTTYNGTSWRGSLRTLEPGQGYIYESKATGDKTFTYGTSNK